ncbi:MAG: DUF3574 domain-containing protein [Clostridia bacterium]|nr:DUF3574 domain-containing protein [Clostridia bacterium]
MNRKWILTLAAVSVIALCVTAVGGWYSAKAENGTKDIQYVLYLGTNDKDTNLPVFTPEEAKAKVREILIRHFGGYTLQEAEGGWIGDDGTLYEEHTIVIYLSDTTLDKVHAAADEMIRVFNQSSVLIQANETTTEFYVSAE